MGSSPVVSTICSVSSTGRAPVLHAGGERILGVRVPHRALAGEWNGYIDHSRLITFEIAGSTPALRYSRVV